MYLYTKCLFYTCIHLKYIYSWVNLIKLILYPGAQNWPSFCLSTKFIAQGHVMLCCGLPSPGEVRNGHSMFKVSFCTPVSCRQQAHIMWWSCWLIVFKAWASLLKLLSYWVHNIRTVLCAVRIKTQKEIIFLRVLLYCMTTSYPLEQFPHP